MTALLYKQVKLVSHVMTFIFVFSGLMLIIPNYPYSVVFFYVCLGLFFMFSNGREQRDANFSALLPIGKCDVVKAAILYSVGIELASIIVAIPFAFISNNINPNGGNDAGIDANVAVFGLAFMVFAVFNVIFFPSFYRTGYKVGASFFKACIGLFVVSAFDVVSPHIISWLDGYDIRQFAVLATGLLAFALLTLLAYKRSVKLYERVDL